MSVARKVLSIALVLCIIVVVSVSLFLVIQNDKIVPSTALLEEHSYGQALDIVHQRLNEIALSIPEEMARIEKLATSFGQEDEGSFRMALLIQGVHDKFAKVNEADKLRYAVDFYAGFVARNIYMNQEYCRQHDVDIDTYVAAFWQRNADLRAKASRYYLSKNWEKDMFDAVKSVTTPLIEYEYSETARLSGNSKEKLCDMLNTEAEHALTFMDFPRVMPDLYQVIMDAP
ncbi:MAG: hypothetical protein ACRBCK_07585 [Alphaproteobacteria bacterium]